MKSDKVSAKIPFHIAIIMDGNGRWAEKRSLLRKFGHRAGVRTLIKTVKYAFSLGVGIVTVYAFSTENRLRPKDEVDSLIDLIRKNFATTFRDLVKRGIRVRVLGERSFFPGDVVDILDKVENESKDGKSGIFNVALNYGGRAEMVRAAKLLSESGKEFNEENFSHFLYTSDQPDPDIIIRTGGEKRLSNFLLYQSAYSELFFVDTLWPDFSNQELDSIIAQYGERDRRYGKV